MWMQSQEFMKEFVARYEASVKSLARDDNSIAGAVMNAMRDTLAAYENAPLIVRFNLLRGLLETFMVFGFELQKRGYGIGAEISNAILLISEAVTLKGGVK